MREGVFRLIPRGNTKDVRCEMDYNANDNDNANLF